MKNNRKILLLVTISFLLSAAIVAFAVDFDTSGRPSYGPADAPVKIIEISDYQCRHCAKLAPIMSEVIKQYGNLVNVTVISLTVNGPYAEMCAELALTAADHGKFWEAHEALFANQTNVSPQFIIELGKKLGIPEKELADNLANHKHRPILKKNYMLAVDELELEYTPTIFINDFQFHGVKTADYLRYYINQELKKKNIASPVGEVTKPDEATQTQISQPGRVPPDMIYPVPIIAPTDSKLKVKVGDKAPGFTLPTIGPPGSTVSLSEYIGKKNVVLSFVPAAWTPACSAQWPEYNDFRKQIEASDTVVIGISVDNIPTLFSWTLTMGFPWFKVASDFWPHGQVANTYGVLRSSGVSERAVFVIDKKGIIRYIDVHDINTRPSVEALIEELNKLQN